MNPSVYIYIYISLTICITLLDSRSTDNGYGCNRPCSISVWSVVARFHSLTGIRCHSTWCPTKSWFWSDFSMKLKKCGHLDIKIKDDYLTLGLLLLTWFHRCAVVPTKSKEPKLTTSPRWLTLSWKVATFLLSFLSLSWSYYHGCRC